MEQNQQFQPQPPVFNQQAPQYQYQPPLAALPTLGFGEANKIFWRKSLDFTGRARRSEFWWGYLSVMIISLIWYVIAGAIAVMMMNGGIHDMASDEEIIMDFMPKFYLLYSPVLLLMVPMYAAMTRRLHDIGRSGWWIVVMLIFTLIILLVSFYLMYKAFDQGDFTTGLSDGFVIFLAVTSLVSSLIVLVLSITIFVFTLLDSKPAENKYGPSPKYQNVQ